MIRHGCLFPLGLGSAQSETEKADSPCRHTGGLQRQCRKRNGTANVDMILAILRGQRDGEHSIASVMQALGALELAGRISVQPDGISINRADNKAKRRKNVSSHLVQESLL